MESKIRHKWTYLQNRNRLTDIENRLVVAKGEESGGGKYWDLGISRCKLLYIGWINNKRKGRVGGERGSSQVTV